MAEIVTNHWEQDVEDSKFIRDAITECFKVYNESRLRTFLDNPYGVMTNNATEEKFRELDLLRNGMMASDTCKGAENIT